MIRINMQNAIKTILLLILFAVLVGCSGGQNADHRGEIGQEIHAYKRAVEDYNVDGMLAFLDQTEFELTIIDHGSNATYEKDFRILAGELRRDEVLQLDERKDPPVGQSYALTLSLGSLLYNSINESNYFVTTTFEVYEESVAIPRKLTDKGKMEFVMVNKNNRWVCNKMVISFDQMDDDWIALSVKSFGSPDINGFGFGSLAHILHP